jgi:hypothetical protein
MPWATCVYVIARDVQEHSFCDSLCIRNECVNDAILLKMNDLHERIVSISFRVFGYVYRWQLISCVSVCLVYVYLKATCVCILNTVIFLPRTAQTTPIALRVCDLNNISKVIWHLNVMQAIESESLPSSRRQALIVSPCECSSSCKIFLFRAYNAMISPFVLVEFEQMFKGLLKSDSTYRRCFRPNHRRSLSRRYRRDHAPRSYRHHKPRILPVISWASHSFISLMSK